MRVAIYIRVSTDQQAKDGDSLHEQESTLVDYANKQGWTIADTYKDEGISGTKLERDEHKRLMQDVKDKKIDIIIFTFLSRWFRNLKHYLNTQDTLDKHNVVWKAVREDYFNTQTPAGRAMISQMMTFGQLEAEMTSERIKAVFEHKISQGEVVSGQTPFGYKIIPNPDGKGKILTPDSDAEIVKDLFDFYIKNGSGRATSLYAYEAHGVVKNQTCINRMLKNKKYIGEHRGNKNYCTPIIDRQIFDTVQDLLSKNIKRNTHRTYIFSGLIKCATCGGGVSGIMGVQRWTLKDGTIRTREYKKYNCNRHHTNKHLCTNKRHFTEKNVEKFLLDNIKSELEKYTTKLQASEIKKDNTKAQIAKILDKKERWKYAFVNGVIEADEFKRETDLLESQLIKLRERPTNITPATINTILSDGFEQTYNKATEPEKREIWRSLIKRLIADQDGSIKIIFL